MATVSDALVFFGATGDLAYKQIFPALQAMVVRGHLNVPIVGVAKAGWGVDQLLERARDSLAHQSGGVEEDAFGRLRALLRYVDGDYRDPAIHDRSAPNDVLLSRNAPLRRAQGPLEAPPFHAKRLRPAEA